MASNEFVRKTISGSKKFSRKGTQGRRKKNGEKRTPHSYTTETNREFEIIKEKAAKAGMKVAFYVGMAAVLYEMPSLN